MKRRAFTHVAAGAALSAAGTWSSLAQAQAKKPEAGTDYQVVDPRAPVEAPAGKIEVVEFFWYNCPHCNAFEPALQAWIKNLPKDVSFRRAPIAFQESFVPQQRLFYTLEAMGLVSTLHPKVFRAIHAEGQALDKPETISAFVARHGVDPVKFMAMFNSFAVQTKCKQARSLADAYKIDGVPTLGIAGRYFTSVSLNGSHERTLATTNFLINLSRKGR